MPRLPSYPRDRRVAHVDSQLITNYILLSFEFVIRRVFVNLISVTHGVCDLTVMLFEVEKLVECVRHNK